MKKHLTSVIALTAICAVVALLLALTNSITAPIIEKNQSAAANEALLVVMPEGEEFNSVDISSYKLPETITEAYSEKSGGYVFTMKTTGYSSDFIIMCGVDKDGNVTGATCLSSTETLGYEKTYGENLMGKNLNDIDAVDTISGATKTTGAYKNAVKDALNAQVILGGGSVDLRSEEEILNDNLSKTLPEAEGKFTALFITEEIEKISEIYTADNGVGAVCVVGEEFIAVDKEGNVKTEVSEDIKTSVSAEAKKILTSTTTEIDISSFGEKMPSNILKAYKTSGGNYVFEIKAAGFGINGDHYYNPSGEYIYIKVSATAKGKIISCQTVSQKETDGIGSACEDKSFYTQFNGKEEANISEIDAISGATITTNGYKTAVSKVFEAIKVLEGES